MRLFFSRNRRSVSGFALPVRERLTVRMQRSVSYLHRYSSHRAVFLFVASRSDMPASMFFLVSPEAFVPCRKHHKTYEGKQQICRCLRSFHYVPCGTFVFGGKRGIDFALLVLPLSRKLSEDESLCRKYHKTYEGKQQKFAVAFVVFIACLAAHSFSA